VLCGGLDVWKEVECSFEGGKRGKYYFQIVTIAMKAVRKEGGWKTKKQCGELEFLFLCLWVMINDRIWAEMAWDWEFCSL